MDDFFSSNSKDGFSMKLWRGERMCLVGFDVDNITDSKWVINSCAFVTRE